MKRILLLSIVCVFLLPKAILAAEKAQLARLHYNGGGDWYNDQDIIPNISEYLNKELKTDFSPTEADVKLTDSNLFDYPFIFATGHGNVVLTDAEISNLQDYLNRGGFIYFDDDYGMDKSFRQLVKQIFPAKEMVELPANHPLFHCYFDFAGGIPKIHKHDDQRPQAFAIFNEIGRIVLLYTFETNITDGWSDAHEDPPAIREQALEMGVNLFYYLMTN
ncbi:MAG TPA: DUF4159 domain-containing protein [Candidatus Cloacimonadota bacterium]|nr:DUF4159 domain-containing protein [Candidatus Cloacimonadota bacterium]